MAAPGLRRWWFPLAALAIPFLCLLVLEALLRLFGYGYSTRLFLKSRIQGRDVFIENPDFTRRFFPPGLERTIEPLAFLAEKPADTCRIFIFGESAAMGDPEPAFGFGRILEVLLRGRYPGKKFEVINVAITAINSHVIREIARQCAPRQGDIWIIYMGNNEVVGPFGAGTVFSSQAPSRLFIHGAIALKATRVGQFFDALLWRLAKRKDVPANWEGMEMFLDRQIPQDDRRMQVVYAHFQRNLEDILKMADAAGVRVLLSTVVSNLKDCPPFASQHRAGLSAAQTNEWITLWNTARRLQSDGKYAEALAGYHRTARIDDRYADLHFALGNCYLALGQPEAARKSFALARDLDTLRFRADTRINQILRQATSQRATPRLQGVDAVAVFDQHNPNGISGEELLYEHVHPNFDGNYLLASTFANSIATLMPPTNAFPLLTADECARRLAFTPWDRFQIMDELIKRLQLPPFTHQLDHNMRLERMKKLRDSFETALRPEAIEKAAGVYREGLTRTPDDWVLHQNFAKLLEAAGQQLAAAEQWRQVLRLMPHNVEACFNLGNLMDAQGKPWEAVAFFQQALQRRPNLPEVRNGLGLALANLGQINEAIRQYQRALRSKPDFAEAHINLGQILAQQGNVAPALAQYALALRWNSNSVGAHINLGKLLAAQGKLTNAAAHYQTAIRLKPDNAIAHYNLGNTLTALNDPEALSQYAEAVRLKPDFAEARYNLGLGYARQGRNADALAQFAEVVRLRPDSADAHLNLGVALAKSRQFQAAITNFQETLRLDPGNAKARQFLEQAQAALK